MPHHLSYDFIQEFKQQLSKMAVIEKLGLDINTIYLSPGLLTGGVHPPDVTYKSSVTDTRGTPSAFLLFSNPNGKMQVAHNVEKALTARHVLADKLNWVIEPPVITALFHGISWALFHINYPLSDGRIRWILQRNLLSPAILNWLTASLQKSRKTVSEQKMLTLFIEPVTAMVNDGDLSTDMQRCAADALDSLAAGRWYPSCCLSHNDLWKGNIMVPSDLRTRETGKFHPGRGFRVIDWAGSRVDGIPFFDLMKFCQSFQVPRYYTRRAILTHCRILDCTMSDARFYLISALALLGQNLDQFPRSAYIHLSHSLFNYINAMV